MMALDRVAIIGSGLAGMHLAQRLAEAGTSVTVFEKSRGTGGRIASARLDGSVESGACSADLGAPLIETSSPDFIDWLQAQGAELWAPRRADTGADPGWVGVPRQSALTRALATSVKLVPQTRVDVVWPDRQGVLLRDESGSALGHFDAVLTATPAPQALPLLEAVPRFRHWAERARIEPRWVMLLRLAQTPQALAGWDWLEADGAPLARAICDSAKPGRSGSAPGAVWQLEAGAEWSLAHLEATPQWVAEQMRVAFERLAGGTVQPLAQRVHRWRYATAVPAAQAPAALWDADTRIGACGDWLNAAPGGSGLETAWRSGAELARLMLEPASAAARVA